MNAQDKIKQLTIDGEGWASGINSPMLGVPFIVIAATKEDLTDVLLTQCDLAGHPLDENKYRRVVVRFPKPQETEPK